MAQLHGEVRPARQVREVVDVQPLAVKVEQRAARSRVVRQQPYGLGSDAIGRGKLPALGSRLQRRVGRRLPKKYESRDANWSAVSATSCASSASRAGRWSPISQ